MKFKSSKRIGPISTGHRQWKDDGHCSFVHGYGRYVEFTFACNERDDKGWVMDFGDLKDVKKELSTTINSYLSIDSGLTIPITKNFIRPWFCHD